MTVDGRALLRRALVRASQRPRLPVEGLRADHFRSALLLLPSSAVLAADLLRRGDRIAGFGGWHSMTYAAGLVQSALVWGLLLLGSSQRGVGGWISRVLFVVSFALSFGGQTYFYQQYNTYVNVDVSRFASDLMGSVLSQLAADLGNYLAVSWYAVVLAILVACAARRWPPPGGRIAGSSPWLGALGLVASLFLPTQYRGAQASPPDVLYLHAAGGLLRTQLGWTEQSGQERPSKRRPLRVEPLASRPPVERNVLLVLLESARADVVCVDPATECLHTPATNELLPQRIPLRQLRALDSSTAISLAVLWAGVAPNESREVLHTWPLLFDYARAAGWSGAYWTSQNLLFGNARLWVEDLPVQSSFSATDLDPESDLDLGAPEHLLVDRALAELPRLREPFFAVVHLSNGHFPYLVDPAGPQPFAPSSTSKAPERRREHFNHYKNAIHQQDRHLARLLRGLRATAAGSRTVVVYTSDHGEAFREHSQSGHTFSLFDEEIRVPGWVDAPPGTLTSEERAMLAAKSDAFTFHPDLTATVLDLMGVWDEPGLQPFRERMVGVSLLRHAVNQRPLPLTNCAGVWSCAYENWGFMQGSKKLLARASDPAWQCYDLLLDPGERRDLGPDACGPLAAWADATFGRLPGPRDE